MSLTKSSPAYARHMDEVMHEDPRDNDTQLYAEWRYLEEQKEREMGGVKQPDNVPAKKQQDGNNVR